MNDLVKKKTVIKWNEPHFLFFILLASLPFSFEYNFTPSFGMDIPDEPLMLVVSAVFFIKLFFLRKDFFSNIFSHPVILLLILWILWIGFTVLFSVEPVLSAKYLAAKAWYIGAFVLPAIIVFANKNHFNAATRAMLVAMSIVTIIILSRHAIYGFRFASVHDSVQPFFRNHVNYSAMLVCLIPVCIGSYISTKKKFEKRCSLVATAIFLIALYFSYSRGAWIALIAGLIGWWLVRQRMLFIGFIISIVIAVCLLLYMVSGDRYLKYAPDYKTTIFHEDFSQHLISTYKLKDLSTVERFYRWVAGVRMIKDYGLQGSGPNTFYPLYKEYTIPAYKTYVSNNQEHSGVHNYFLLVVIEQGLPGVCLLLIMIGTVFYFCEKGYRNSMVSGDKIIYTVIAVIFTMILALNCLSDLIETDKIGSLFFLCIGTLVAADIGRIKELKSATYV